MLMAGALVLLAALTSLGYGLAALRFLESWRPGLSRGTTIGDLGILGFIVLGILAAVANLFLPLGGLVAGSVCLTGLVLLAAFRRAALHRAAAFGWRVPAALLMLVTACLFLGAMIQGSTRTHFDTGLYHLQAVRLALEYPLILGVGNIHMRFGYNSNLFPTAAMFTGGFGGIAGALSVNALLATFVTLGVLQRAGEGGVRALRSSLFGLLAVALIVFTPLLLFRAWAGTPSSDLPSGLMIIYTFHLALRLSDLDGWPDAGSERAGLAVMLVMTAVLAVTLKLSAVPVLLVLPLLALAWRRGRLMRREVALAGAAGVVISLPWLARGMAASGCLAYPSPASCLPLPWRIAEDVARSDIAWMQAWARQPDTLPEIVLADWSWFPGWLASIPREPSGWTFALLAGAAVMFVLARLTLPRLVTAGALPPAPPRCDLVLLQGAALAGIGFWFLSAPLVRYGQAWLALPPLLAIAHCMPVGWRQVGTTPARQTAWALTMRPRLRDGLVVVLALAACLSLATSPQRRLFDTGYASMPAVAVQQRMDLDGLSVRMPMQGNQCWDAPRLCTPQIRDGVVARRFFWTWIVLDPS